MDLPTFMVFPFVHLQTMALHINASTT